MFGVCGFIHSRLDINLRHLNSTNDTNFAYLFMYRLNEILKKTENVCNETTQTRVTFIKNKRF